MEALSFYTSPRPPQFFQHAPHGYPADVMDMPGIGHIPARALILSRPGDIVAIHPDLAVHVPHILMHYGELGLAVAGQFLPELGYPAETLAAGLTLDTFLWSPEANAAAPDPRRLDATLQYNDKNWFMEHCATQGYPVPESETFAAGTVPQDLHLGYPVYVKAAVSGSGKHVVECRSLAEVQAAAKLMPEHYQAQAAVPRIVAALNVLYFIDEAGEAHFVCTTEQILEGAVHNGNRYPSVFDPRAITDAVANDAAQAGVRRLCGFDVLVSQTHGFQLVECNPRPNGSSYYAMAAYRLGITGPWQGIGLPTTHRWLAGINLQGLVYDPSRGSGVVLVGWGSIAVGGLGFLIAGTPDEQATLLAELRQRL